DLGRARHPLVAEPDHLLGRAEADELAHAERLEAVDLLRRLMAEAVARDVEHEARLRHAAARRYQWVERIAGGRGEHEIGRAERADPIALALVARDGAANVGLAALQAAHGAEKVGEAAEIARFLDV